MGPNESQLRAALREGEGDSPDAGLLISHAVRVRRDRRRRVTSIVTGVAVVVLVAAGITALATSGSGEEGGASNSGYAAGAASTAGPAAPDAKAAAQGAVSSARANAAGVHGGAAAALPCPTSASHYMLPGGGGIGDFGSDSKLFTGQVAAVKLCAYPAGKTVPRSNVLSGAAAAEVADPLESAPSQPEPGPLCDQRPVEGRVEILAISTSGTALKPVVLTIGCPYQATNGTAVRYLVKLPAAITALLR